MLDSTCDSINASKSWRHNFSYIFDAGIIIFSQAHDVYNTKYASWEFAQASNCHVCHRKNQPFTGCTYAHSRAIYFAHVRCQWNSLASFLSQVKYVSRPGDTCPIELARR